jgi:hypothetical protein
MSLSARKFQGGSPLQPKPIQRAGVKPILRIDACERVAARLGIFKNLMSLSLCRTSPQSRVFSGGSPLKPAPAILDDITKLRKFRGSSSLKPKLILRIGIKPILRIGIKPILRIGIKPILRIGIKPILRIGIDEHAFAFLRIFKNLMSFSIFGKDKAGRFRLPLKFQKLYGAQSDPGAGQRRMIIFSLA